MRLQVVGFRVLSYDGENARVDLAVRGSSEGTTVTASAVYKLVWEDGDWKINANVSTPFDFARFPTRRDTSPGENDMACGITDPLACVGDAVNNAVGDAIENMANAVLEAFGKAVASLGTLWVNIGTPNLTGSGGGSSIAAGTTAPNSDGIITVLGWVTWISIALAAMSIILLGALIATRMRNGEGFQAAGRMGIVLGAIFLISGATALVSGLLPNGPQGAGGTVLFLQSSLWWYMGAAAVVSVIIGGVRMAWEQRAEPGKDTIKSLLTLIVVAGAGVTIVGLLVSAFDSFSVWILNGALKCDVGTDTACFGNNIADAACPHDEPRDRWPRGAAHHHPGTDRDPRDCVPNRADDRAWRHARHLDGHPAAVGGGDQHRNG